jgi:hypothetical protein
MADAFADVMADMDGVNIFGGTEDLKARRDQLLKDAIDAVAPVGEEAAKLLEERAQGFAMGDDSDIAAGRTAALTGGVSSLAALGGGGGVGGTIGGLDGLLDSSREQSRELRRANENLGAIRQSLASTPGVMGSPQFTLA